MPLGQTKFARGWMDVQAWVPKGHPRSIYRLGTWEPCVDFGVHENSLINLRRGLVERVFLVEGTGGLEPPPLPVAGRVEQKLGPFRRCLVQGMSYTTPFSTEQFVECYEGRRRAVYEKAADSLKAKAVTRRDSYLSTFVKAEKINFTAKNDPAPRVIQPRGPRYNVSVGVYLKRIEHALYHRVDGVWGETTIMKGHNAEASGRILRQKWDSFRDPVAVGLDASRFDQHVSADALRWEHSVYLQFFRGTDRAHLRRLLEWQLVNKGFGRARDGAIKYQVSGCRMSGDMNTGLGNCLLMCAMVYAYLRDVGLVAKLANNGDDCVLFMERRDLPKLAGLRGWFRRLGFTMKQEDAVDTFERLEFCQTQPVETTTGWLMVRKHGIAQAKDAHTVFPLRDRTTFERYWSSVGQCGLSLTGGVPVQEQFYAALNCGAPTISAAPQLESGFARLAKGMNRQMGHIGPEARASYWKAFGVLPDHQMAIEEAIRERSLAYTAPQPSGNPIPTTIWLY